jgi:NADH:ubiquinone oxidoreductase subunit 6 (subunit J)
MYSRLSILSVIRYKLKHSNVLVKKLSDFNVSKIGKVCYVEYIKVPEVLFMLFLMSMISDSLNGY